MTTSYKKKTQGDVFSEHSVVEEQKQSELDDPGPLRNDPGPSRKQSLKPRC